MTSSAFIKFSHQSPFALPFLVIFRALYSLNVYLGCQHPERRTNLLLSSFMAYFLPKKLRNLPRLVFVPEDPRPLRWDLLPPFPRKIRSYLGEFGRTFPRQKLHFQLK